MFITRFIPNPSNVIVSAYCVLPESLYHIDKLKTIPSNILAISIMGNIDIPLLNPLPSKSAKSSGYMAIPRKIRTQNATKYFITSAYIFFISSRADDEKKKGSAAYRNIWTNRTMNTASFTLALKIPNWSCHGDVAGAKNRKKILLIKSFATPGNPAIISGRE
jgi:hypothetical protein